MDETSSTSLQNWKDKLNTATEKGDKKGQVHAYDNLGQLYGSQGHYTEAIACFKNVASMATDRYVETRAYYYLGKCYNGSSQHEEAISFFEKSLRISSEVNDMPLAIMASKSLGNILRALKRFQEAIANHKKCLEYAIKSSDKEAEEIAYFDLGVTTGDSGDFQNAVEYFEMFLQIAKTLDDRAALVSGYSYLGNAYIALGNNNEAVKSHQNSLNTAIEIGDKNGEKIAYCNMARAYSSIGQYEKEIQCHEKRLNLAVEKEDRAEEGNIYRELGRANFDIKKYEEAISNFTKNLNIVKEIGNRSEEGLMYCFLGEANYLSGKYKVALEYYEKCLNTSIEVGNAEKEREAYNRLGILYGKLNCYEKSIKYFTKELQTIINKGEDEARVYCNLGIAYIETGRYEEAFNCFDKCLAIALRNNDTELQQQVYCNMGNAYAVLGNGPESIKHHTKSAEIAMNIGTKKAEAPLYCFLSRNSNNYENAIEYAKKHLNVAQMLGDTQAKASAYYDIGKNSFLLGKNQDAIKYLEHSVNTAKEVGDRLIEGEAYESLGCVYAECGSSTKAIEYFEKQFNIAVEIGNKQSAGGACRNLGMAFLFLFLYGKGNDKGKPEYKHKAEQFLKESLQWYDSMFQDLGERQDQHKINVFDTFIDTHKLLAELYIKTEQPKRAMLVSEQERGRALEDLLIGKYNLQLKTESSYDFDGWADITNKVLSSDCCILFFSDLAKPNRKTHKSEVGSWVFDLEKNISFHRHELKEIKTSLKERFPDEDIQTSKDILHNLVSKTYATMSVREAANCENRSFNITPAGSVEDVPSTSQESKSVKRCVYDEELDEDCLELLYDTLISPVQEKLTKDEIVIIPEGSLFKIPFAALRDPTTKLCLGETKRVRIAPSLTILKILKETSADSHSRTGALIVGDPDVNGKRMLKGKQTSFHSLPNARIEAEKIGEVLGVSPLIGTQATKHAIKQRLREGVAVIHFATHGCADSGEIVLSPPADLQSTKKIPNEEDYLLTINEVQEIGLQARLVVLSCCHSGRGEIKSDGVIGMSRAFLAAGALAVVASLWAVDDRATRVFMEKFYAHLKQGQGASTSLQQAMKEMRNMVQYEKPMFWAPFILIGNDVTIKL